jgi:hypothetical protein
MIKRESTRMGYRTRCRIIKQLLICTAGVSHDSANRAARFAERWLMFRTQESVKTVTLFRFRVAG